MTAETGFRRRSARRVQRHLIVAALSLVFAVLFAGSALAATTVSVSSSPEKRGSVTPGLDSIIMQSLAIRTSTGQAQLTGLKINEFGTGQATTSVGAVKLYKETNGSGGLQFTGIPADTLLSTAPGTFGAEDQLFTFSTPETISDTTTTYYIVYDIAAGATAGTTVGSRIVDKNSVIVDAPATVSTFTNLQSREITVVAIPHGSVRSQIISPFSASTNLCQTCHSVHLAPDFSNQGLESRRILVQPYFESPDVVNDPTKGSDVYNALCLTCHDGTGASGAGMDVKSQYNGAANYAGHKTSADSTNTATGYKSPQVGKKYNAGVKIPCMVCHDVHTSSTHSTAMMADKLYDYSVSNGWEDPNWNGRIDAGDEECQVCHKYSTETTRTAVVMGYDLTLPSDHDARTNCLQSCHVSPHALTVP